MRQRRRRRQKELLAVAGAAVVFAPCHFRRIGAEVVTRDRVKRQISYAGLVEKLAAIGIRETEANLRNKISRGGFTGAFLIQCLVAMGVTALRLED